MRKESLSYIRNGSYVVDRQRIHNIDGAQLFFGIEVWVNAYVLFTTSHTIQIPLIFNFCSGDVFTLVSWSEERPPRSMLDSHEFFLEIIRWVGFSRRLIPISNGNFFEIGKFEGKWDLVKVLIPHYPPIFLLYPRRHWGRATVAVDFWNDRTLLWVWIKWLVYRFRGVLILILFLVVDTCTFTVVILNLPDNFFLKEGSEWKSFS